MYLNSYGQFRDQNASTIQLIVSGSAPFQFYMIVHFRSPTKMYESQLYSAQSAFLHTVQVIIQTPIGLMMKKRQFLAQQDSWYRIIESNHLIILYYLL